MWRFYWRLAKRVPGLLWASAGRVDQVISVVSLLLTALGFTPYWPFSAAWVLVPLALLFVYGLMRANYEAFRGIESERDDWRKRYEQLNAGPEADDSLPFPYPRRVPPGAAGKAYFAGESFRLTDLSGPEHALNQTVLRDRTFYQCTIHGPVVLMPMSGTQFVGETKFFDESHPGYPESLFYTIPADGPGWFSGVVGTEGCVFRDCTFVEVGIAGHPPTIHQVRGHLAGGGGVHIL